MSPLITLEDLQVSVQDRSAFGDLADYYTLCHAFLTLVEEIEPTRIVSPRHPNYIFYQYGAKYGHKITRPLNTNLLVESSQEFQTIFERFIDFLKDLKRYQDTLAERNSYQRYIESKEINQAVYTIQQVVGCIGDSFPNVNQSRKRVGQLFENLIKLIIQTVGLNCESRTVRLPIPDFPGYEMSYELDLVFSRDKAILAAEHKYLHPSEVIGSVKTTSKDRIDKIFLDKYMLTKLLGRSVSVIAIFLHDVQRARRGQSIFGINSTFKTNHFLSYTVALNRLDGVYYVDPRPEMVTNQQLTEQINDFQQFLLQDLWTLSQYD